MSVSQNLRIIVRLCTLGILVTCLWFFSGKAAHQTFERQLPITINQLPSENGVIPAELQCEPARLTAPNEVQSFSCLIKNNTNKNIRALSATYTITTEQNGKEDPNTSFITLESLINSDFDDTTLYRPIQPGNETTLRTSGPTSYENATIKGIRIRIDYVEFGDGTIMGHTGEGSNIIALIREGAGKYKGWLKQKYLENGKSVEAIVSLLQKKTNIPIELGLNDTYQEQGAQAYQQRALKLYKIHGVKELKRFLDK